MSDIVKPEKQGLIDIFHGDKGDMVLPKPFERDIFLFDTEIAGTSHVEGLTALVPQLNEETRVKFFREPDNKYDKNAIVIRTEKGSKLGYVPRKDNVVFARLMDAGKQLFGKIADKKVVDDAYVKIRIGIYLHD